MSIFLRGKDALIWMCVTFYRRLLDFFQFLLSRIRRRRVPNVPRGWKFSGAEKSAIQKSWNNAKNRKVGQEIILALIRDKPSFATSFQVDPTLEPEQLVLEKNVQDQAERIEKFLDEIVTSYLDSKHEAKVREMCDKVGEVHFWSSVHFTADNWLLYKRTMVGLVVGSGEEKYEKLAKNGWNKLLGFVIREIKNGFLRQVLTECSSVCSEEVVKKYSIQQPVEHTISLPV